MKKILVLMVLLAVLSVNVFCEDYKDGKYTGTGNGYNGSLEVEIEIKDGKISNAAVTKHNENAPGSAIKEIPEKILKAQKVEGVDVVTGASVTSKAILSAASEALEKASVKAALQVKVEPVAEGSILLPAPDKESGLPLMKCLNMRRTCREYRKDMLTFDIISELLWAANGINRIDSGKRTAPSARNSQEIDIYVALETGLYLYNHKKHLLSPVLDKDIREFTGTQEFTQTAPVNLIYVADQDRLAGGDGTMKAFYSAVDTGFISQNVYLYCASKGLATVVLGMVDREKLAEIMKLPKNKKIMLSQPVGYPKK